MTATVSTYATGEIVAFSLGALNATTGARKCTGGGLTIGIYNAFTGTLTLRIRGEINPATGLAWADQTSGWKTLATWTAANDMGADETANSVALWGGVWEVELIMSAYTDGAALGWLGVQKAIRG